MQTFIIVVLIVLLFVGWFSLEVYIIKKLMATTIISHFVHSLSDEEILFSKYSMEDVQRLHWKEL